MLQQQEEPQQPELEAEQPDESVQVMSVVTSGTNRTMISNLQKQLCDEKDARAKLESELQNLKQMSEQIAQHLKIEK